MSEETAEQVREMVSKGAAGGHLFFAVDADATYAELQARGVEFTEGPTEQAYGTGFGLRDPFGNHLRIAQLEVA